ncbi:STN domain-containing protein [Chitinophaga vietnamensis]|uniref:STN domain-containing protein n=1 Tax=Chitinophaga vietnamensis TaxID=2593957 RepID=UPI001178B056|nr:STN domain-containing protein [Chitinophaga vietnamensis]
MLRKPCLQKIFFTTALFLCCTVGAFAQGLLNKSINLNVKQQRLSAVLNLIGKQGGFYFSYISNSLPQDSLVTLSVQNKTVKQVLDILLDGNYQYKESGDYIILLKRPGQAYFVVSGFVTDRHTGQRISNASVYERQQLISTLTNNDGYFRLRLRDKYPTAAISVSKDLYGDTSLLLRSGVDQDIAVTISPVTHTLQTVEITGYQMVEKTWFGRLMLSSRQKAQSLNIRFLADKPYQASIAPGLGTHGKMSGQVVNKLSLNLTGGYTAGVDGLEIGTLFNIVKNNVKSVQISGGINIVGGKVKGAQIAGLHNNVLDSMTGVQVAGVSNIVRGNVLGVQFSGVVGKISGRVEGAQLSGVISLASGYMNGAQISGVYNDADSSMGGAQVSGVVSHVRGDADGTQVSSVGNIVNGTLNGAQVSVIFNYARKMNGIQVGLVNIADTSTGYSIGLINFVKKGYHKLSLFSTELTPFNFAWKSGRKELYSILVAGASVGANNKSYTFGYGMGHEFPLPHHLVITAEITSQTLFLGDWSHTSQINRLQPSLQWRLNKQIALFGGPALVVYFNNNGVPSHGYKTNIPPNYPGFRIGDSGHGWLGWQAGITLF